jgi:hypothetical protein
LVAEQKLFLHTFLVERIGNPRIQKLPVGHWNVLALKAILLWQQLCGNPDALRKLQRRTYDRIHGRLCARGVPTGQVRPVAEYHAGGISPRCFYREHVRNGVPCVIRGFAVATDRWRLERLAGPNAVIDDDIGFIRPT